MTVGKFGGRLGVIGTSNFLINPLNFPVASSLIKFLSVPKNVIVIIIVIIDINPAPQKI